MRAPGPLSAAVLALLAVSALAAATPDVVERDGAREGVGARRARSVPADRWLRLVHEYAGGARGAAGGEGDWFPRPIPLTLPIGDASVPVLLLPVPVPAPTPAAPAERASPAADQQYPQCQLTTAAASSGPGPVPIQGGATSAPGVLPAPADRAPRPFEPPPPPPFAPSHYTEEPPAVPRLEHVVNSQQLVELFRAQVAPQPELPPVLLSDAVEQERAPQRPGRLVRLRRYQLQTSRGSHPSPVPVPHDPSPAPAPPAPRLARSLVLRGELTVPRAGYSEPYTVWWDAESGAARLDLHGGATSLYRSVLPDGSVRHVEMRVERSGAGEVRRCATRPPRPAAAHDRALPVLPDLQAFSFTGHVESEFGRVERWAHALSGGVGELGGARGEALLFRHELLLARGADNETATPLKYSVSVDSSVLGTGADGFVHRYTELRDQRHEAGFFVLDLVESCDEVQQSAAPLERLEPLREFVLSHRDPVHDRLYERFKAKNARRYWDDTEEAVRKNLLMQHNRFIDSGNRQGATFAMEINHLGDRLDAELDVLRGVREEAGAGARGETFPHARDQVEAARARLPRQFDWRQHGAVTHVRNQGSCSSCWAFAVTGAVEGALFVRTGALAALSEQVLVDCAGPFGGHGCGGTWPSAAYEYVRARGQPALDDYKPYVARQEACAADAASPVTFVSGHVNVTSKNVDALKVAIRRHAPTVVIIDSTAKSFVFYKKGVINDERCAKNKAEHAVLAVGWGVRRGGEEHIIVKNSWSTAWGEAGFARLHARSNTCGVLSRPSYPRLERPDVRRLPAAAAATAPSAPSAPAA